MKIFILGGGLSAISLAYFMQNNRNIEEIIISEKEERLGGLCRSFRVNGIFYDIGPHIIFSKDQDILNFMNTLLDENKEIIRRSNRILYKNSFIQYPFENDLSKLPKEELDYCLDSFLNNPYEKYRPENMLQYFLKTFGEGITNIYLRPYNEKIWKFDPCFMGSQMVERIPKPPKEDILRSAQGETVDGYIHQLYFTYPKMFGIEALLKAFVNNFSNKTKIYTNNEVLEIRKKKKYFLIKTFEREIVSEKVISTIPLNVLTEIYDGSSKEILEAGRKLKYNSIIIVIINVRADCSGDNFAFMIPDKNIIFHRISKLDYLGEKYHIKDSATYMIEITYRKNDIIDKLPKEMLIDKIAANLIDIGFIETKDDVNFTDIRRFEYAYVIYDLEHRKNVSKIVDFFETEGVKLNGRFGEFEYLNMDAVIRHSKDLSEKL